MKILRFKFMLVNAVGLDEWGDFCTAGGPFLQEAVESREVGKVGEQRQKGVV